MELWQQHPSGASETRVAGKLGQGGDGRKTSKDVVSNTWAILYIINKVSFTLSELEAGCG